MMGKKYCKKILMSGYIKIGSTQFSDAGLAFNLRRRGKCFLFFFSWCTSLSTYLNLLIKQVVFQYMCKYKQIVYTFDLVIIVLFRSWSNVMFK